MQPSLTDDMEGLYAQGRILASLELARSSPDFPRLARARDCLMLARIAMQCGAPWMALRSTLRARRLDPDDQECLAQECMEIARRRGPVAVLDRLRGVPAHHQDLLVVRAHAAADLRDFDLAERLHREALEMAPDDPWVQLLEATILERQDRPEAALEAALRSGTHHPGTVYRPGIQTAASLLAALGRDDEALALLRTAEDRCDSGSIATQRYALLADGERWDEADLALERVRELCPLMESTTRKWFQSQKALVAYRTSRFPEAFSLARELEDPFHREFAERLETWVDRPREAPPRILLPVRYERQSFKTCAPATLSALARFWGVPQDQVAMVAAFCYDGAPAWEQRQWAEENGWLVREFRVDEPSAVALLLRGIPFAISIVHGTSAHMMAVVGHDPLRRTFLFRDPSTPGLSEAPIEEFLRGFRAFGPHGMVFLSTSDAPLIEGIELPETRDRDTYFRLSRALARHDLSKARRELESLVSTAPDSDLALHGRLALARYNAQSSEQSEVLGRLLERYPEDAALRIQVVNAAFQSSRHERIRLLQDLCGRSPGHASLDIHLADLLLEDARERAEVERLVGRAFRQSPTLPEGLVSLARLREQSNDLESSLDLLRWAAEIESFREDLWQNWFLACQRTGRSDEALDFLQRRFAALGARSSSPALTLAWALQRLDRPTEGLAVLDEAAKLRPDDPLVPLRLAGFAAQLGDHAGASARLASVRGRIRESEWLREAARLAGSRSDLDGRMRWLREASRLEPLALDLLSGQAQCLAQLEGLGAARAFLASVVESFPSHCGIRRLGLEWQDAEDHSAREASLAAFLELVPDDPWALRELSLVHSATGRIPEAIEVASSAIVVDPGCSWSHSILGRILVGAGDLEAAEPPLRRALRLDVDNTDAIANLLGSSRSVEQRRENLLWIEGELVRQTVQGDGLLAWVREALNFLPDDQILASLRKAHGERPDLWHTWSTLSRHLCRMALLDDALEVAVEATRRFPWNPRALIDLAAVHRHRDELGAEIETARRAWLANPAWWESSTALGDALERAGNLEEAIQVYRRASSLSPESHVLLGALAHAQWKSGAAPEAIDTLVRALRLSSSYSWAWEMLGIWSSERGDRLQPVRLARALAAERPGDRGAWLQLARRLDSSRPEERLSAVEKALELDRTSVEAWDLKIQVLSESGRHEEASRACLEAIGATKEIGPALEGRKAWVLAQQGDLNDAVVAMEGLLEIHPYYTWGWMRLADWCDRLERKELARTARERLVALNPQAAWAHRELGTWLLENDQREEGERNLERALDLEPSESGAAISLSMSRIRHRDLDGADQVLSRMRLHQPSPETEAVAARIALLRGEIAEAEEILVALCSASNLDGWPLSSVVAAFEEQGRGPTAQRALETWSVRADGQLDCAAMHVRHLWTRKSTWSAVRFLARLPEGEKSRRAFRRFLAELPSAKGKWLVPWLLRIRGRRIHADLECWGQAGYALVARGRMRSATRWLHDWRERTGAASWMLFNLAVATRSLGRIRVSQDVVGHVLVSEVPPDEKRSFHLFAAIEASLNGELEQARAHLLEASARRNVYLDAALLELATTLVEIGSADLSDRTQVWRSRKPLLRSALGDEAMVRDSPDVLRTIRRAGKSLAGKRGCFQVRLWLFWKGWFREILMVLGAAMMFSGPALKLWR